MADLEAIARRFYTDVVSKGDIDAIDELLAEDFIEHEEFPGLTQDREGVKQFFAMFRRSFPDMNADLEDIDVAGEKVWTRATFRGTFTGEDFMGMPANGKSFDVTVIDCVRFRDGLGVEHWGATDNLKMMQQLGAIPEQ